MVLSASSQEAPWLKILVEELDAESTSTPTIIRCGNNGSIDLANAAGYRQRTKHIDV